MDSNWSRNMSYKWRKQITLTKPEGAAMEKIISQHDCANISQLCKKIVHEELLLIPNEKEGEK